MAYVKVCAVDDLWEGEMESFEVDGHEVLLLSPVGGPIRAFQGVCPHQDIPLIEGKFDGKLLVCRAHQWAFDAATGNGVNPANCRLAQYPVKVEGDAILVDTEGVAALFASSLTHPNNPRSMAMAEISTAYLNNKVGPIMRQGELAQAVAEAAAIDNPGKAIRVEDKLAYLRIQTDDEMVLERSTIEELLGRPFSMNDLEVELSSFAGRIETQADRVRFYFARHL